MAADARGPRSLPSVAPGAKEGPEAQDALRGRLEALLGNLKGLLDDMDSSALEDLLARAMFAADTNGRAQSAASLQ